MALWVCKKKVATHDEVFTHEMAQDWRFVLKYSKNHKIGGEGWEKQNRPWADSCWRWMVSTSGFTVSRYQLLVSYKFSTIKKN